MKLLHKLGLSAVLAVSVFTPVVAKAEGEKRYVTKWLEEGTEKVLKAEVVDTTQMFPDNDKNDIETHDLSSIKVEGEDVTINYYTLKTEKKDETNATNVSDKKEDVIKIVKPKKVITLWLGLAMQEELRETVEGDKAYADLDGNDVKGYRLVSVEAVMGNDNVPEFKDILYIFNQYVPEGNNHNFGDLDKQIAVLKEKLATYNIENIDLNNGGSKANSTSNTNATQKATNDVKSPKAVPSNVKQDVATSDNGIFYVLTAVIAGLGLIATRLKFKK